MGGDVAAICRITASMTGEPQEISGPGEFEGQFTRTTQGLIERNRGTQGYQAIGKTGNVLPKDSPDAGTAFKEGYGDLPFRTMYAEPHHRVRTAATPEILRPLGALSHDELEMLSEFGPALPVKNHRRTLVSDSRPAFTLTNTK